MDLTAKDVHNAEFRAKGRGGYHSGDVDDFLERVANGVDQLTKTVAELKGRLVEAERLAKSQTASAPVVENTKAEAPMADLNEAMTRTLVLAQRTADAAIAEAQAEADRLTGDSRAEADRMLRDARERSEQMMAEAADAAERFAEETQSNLRADVTRLETARDQLREDVEILERFVHDERRVLRTALSDAVSQLDAGFPALRTTPQLHAVDVPASSAARIELPQSFLDPMPTEVRSGGANGDGIALIAPTMSPMVETATISADEDIAENSSIEDADIAEIDDTFIDPAAMTDTTIDELSDADIVEAELELVDGMLALDNDRFVDLAGSERAAEIVAANDATVADIRATGPIARPESIADAIASDDADDDAQPVSDVEIAKARYQRDGSPDDEREMMVMRDDPTGQFRYLADLRALAADGDEHVELPFPERDLSEDEKRIQEFAANRRFARRRRR